MRSRIAAWQQARFGMFIHFGLYSLLERGEWVYYQEHISRDEYARLAESFCPRHCRVPEWVAVAPDACVRYMMLTARCLTTSCYGSSLRLLTDIETRNGVDPC